jgi:hypothetical protein
VAYNDTLVAQQHRVMTHVTRFTVLLESADSARLDSTLGVALRSVDSAAAFVAALPTPDTAQVFARLRAAALAQFAFYRTVLQGEYRQMMALHLKHPVTEADQRRAQELIERISTQEAPLNAEYRAAQEALAAQFGSAVADEEPPAP